MSNSCYAILVDAGHAKYALRPKGSKDPISDLHVSEFIEKVGRLSCVKGMRFHRVYWYDARPMTRKIIRPDGKELDLASSETAKINTEQQAAIAKLPYVAMRFGELSFRGWSVKAKKTQSAKGTTTFTPDDLKPNIQQKGVDMRIGLDIAALSLKRHVQVIVLVSGDSDFVPAMKFARREGLQIVLVTLGKSVLETMRDHADVVVHNSIQDLQ